MRDAPKWKVAVVWVLTVILALLMAMVGSFKFAQPEQWERMASTLDLPFWLMQVAGVTELVGAVLLLFPRVAAIGGSTLAVVMLGAALAQVRGGQPGDAIAPLVYLAVALFITYQRMDQLPWRSDGPTSES